MRLKWGMLLSQSTIIKASIWTLILQNQYHYYCWLETPKIPDSASSCEDPTLSILHLKLGAHCSQFKWRTNIKLFSLHWCWDFRLVFSLGLKAAYSSQQYFILLVYIFLNWTFPCMCILCAHWSWIRLKNFWSQLPSLSGMVSIVALRAWNLIDLNILGAGHCVSLQKLATFRPKRLTSCLYNQTSQSSLYYDLRFLLLFTNSGQNSHQLTNFNFKTHKSSMPMMFQ